MTFDSYHELIKATNQRTRITIVTPKPWMQWFEGDQYLGERSARTKPDPVNSKHPCKCDQCVQPLEQLTWSEPSRHEMAAAIGSAP